MANPGDGAAITLWSTLVGAFVACMVWLSKLATRKFRAAAAKEDELAEAAAAAKRAHADFAAAARLPPPAPAAVLPAHLPATAAAHVAPAQPSHEASLSLVRTLEAELGAKRNECSRAQLLIEDLHAVCRRIRQEHEDEVRKLQDQLRRQRESLDFAQLEDKKKSDALLEGRGREEALIAELDALHRQITGGTHARQPDARTNSSAADRRAGGDRGLLRTGRDGSDPAGAPRPEKPFGARRRPTD